MAIEADIQAALMARVETISTDPALTLVYREKLGTLPNGDFILVDNLWNDAPRKALDDIGQHYAGVLVLGVTMRLGFYDAAYRAVAGAVAAHFRDQVLTYGDANVVIERVETGRGIADGSEHYRIPVSAFWRA